MTELVFDIGGTKSRFALVEDGVLGEVRHIETDKSAGGFARMLTAVQDLLEGRKLSAMAGGFAGQIEGEEGKVVSATNLPNWMGIKMYERMGSIFRCPIYIENDVVMGGIGEAHFGMGLKEGVMAYFTVSTGVNGARLVNGEVDRTIGWFEVGKQITAGTDGRLQSLESLTSGSAFEMRRGISPKEVRDRKVWEVEEHNLAIGMFNTIIFWNPEVIVFNGSMMRDIDLRGVQRDLDKIGLVMPKWPRLEYTKLGDSAGLYGSLATLAQKRKNHASKVSVR